MAFSVNDLFNWVGDLANKVQSGDGFSDDQFNEAMKFVNIELFNSGSGLEEEYQVGNPIPRRAWQITNRISDDFRFLVTPVTITKGSNGYFAFPADYAAFSSLYYRYVLNNPSGNPTWTERWIEMVTDSELVQRLQSSIKPPSAFYPVAAWSALGFKVYPEAVSSIRLTYLKVPRTPVRGYTLTPNGEETIYDPTTSIQAEWPDTMFPNFAVRVAKWLGVNIRDEELYAWMDKRVKEGE